MKPVLYIANYVRDWSLGCGIVRIPVFIMYICRIRTLNLHKARPFWQRIRSNPTRRNYH